MTRTYETGTAGLIHGERETREYKLDIPEDKEKYLKTAVAFANGTGGEIVFGVRDHTWEFAGFKLEDAMRKRDAVVNSIYDACTPNIQPRRDGGTRGEVRHCGHDPRRRA